MTSPQIVIVVLGLLFGYWGVSKLMDFQSKNAKDKSKNGNNKGALRPAPYPGPRSAKAGSRDWWEVLQVDRNATLDVVHAAYTARMEQYHPDKVAGLGEKLRRLAEEKAAEINGAYYTVLKERGLR
jgi:DnaJ-domain-containing protein 1